MRFENRSWLLLAAGVMASAAVAACSADAGSGSGVGDDSGAQDDTGSTADGSTNHDAGTRDSTAPTDSSTQMDSTHADTSTADTSTADTSAADTSTADTGTSDTGTTSDAMGDSGLPPVGSACSPQNSTQQQPCGLCGVQNRVCLAPDGGTPVWQAWGFCQNEVANGCTPGAMTTEACGLCGMRQKQCQNDCTYAVGACTGQPPNACAPGSTDYQPGLSCDAGGRTRSCRTSCTWGDYGQCEVADGGVLGNYLDVPGTVGGKATKVFNMPATPKVKHIYSGNCPVTLSSIQTSNSLVQLVNSHGQSVTVSLWHSQAPGGSDIDSLLAVYNTTLAPSTDVQRQACMTGTYGDDTCSDTTTDSTSCLSGWAGLMSGDSHQITIPANGFVWVYSAAYSSTASGDYQLNVMAHSFQ